MNRKISRTIKPYPPAWKGMALAESEKDYWEIVNDPLKKVVNFIHLPNPDKDDGHIQLSLTYDQFDDLVNFIQRIK